VWKEWFMQLMNGISINGATEIRIALAGGQRVYFEEGAVVISLACSEVIQGKSPLPQPRQAPGGDRPPAQASSHKAASKATGRRTRYYCKDCALCNQSGKKWRCANCESPKYESTVNRISGCQAFKPKGAAAAGPAGENETCSVCSFRSTGPERKCQNDDSPNFTKVVGANMRCEKFEAEA
jgi:hypothetical protein